MGGIVAEASGTSIPKEMQQTIDAVGKATAGLAANEGATADKIAKLLRLDKSSAWRRLGKAVSKGFIANLESKRGQPGRYRLTAQEVEAEELMPSIKSLEAALQPVQPRNPTHNPKVFEALNDCGNKPPLSRGNAVSTHKFGKPHIERITRTRTELRLNYSVQRSSGMAKLRHPHNEPLY